MSIGEPRSSTTQQAGGPTGSVSWRDGRLLLDRLLADQPDLSAVERFSQFHEEVRSPLQGQYYSALMPTAAPGPGQQLAFEVDLDRCTGCKACVSACHSLNGLDDGETWRDVGMIVGGSPALPILQHVTTACHHCVEPACLLACPTEAYEKDPATGIVRHLDDQCFGCQYCALACPYDVPKYHAAKGIVRKCDMCSGRLGAGEAPACVQACPCAAIAIRVVAVADRVAAGRAGEFLATAPDPEYTLPTTVYKSNRRLDGSALPADDHHLEPEHAHLPLVAMLVLTQAAVGGYLVDVAARLAGAAIPPLAIHAIVAFLIGQAGLAAATLHLGRPLYAYRAILGFRHSWLSREVIAFSLFAGGSATLTGLLALQPAFLAALPAPARDLVARGVATLPAAIRAPLVEAVGLAGPGLLGLQMTLSVALLGLMGVGTSAMVYHVCRRPTWRGGIVGAKFAGTTVVLGLASWVAVEAWCRAAGVPTFAADRSGLPFGRALVAAALAKLAGEAALLLPVPGRWFAAIRRSALLTTGPLGRFWAARCACGLGAALVAAGLVAAAASGRPVGPVAGLVLWSAVGAALLVGELLERGLFFAAVVRLKMPGR